MSNMYWRAASIPDLRFPVLPDEEEGLEVGSNFVHSYGSIVHLILRTLA